jgi:Tfp pilus assembly protein PilF
MTHFNLGVAQLRLGEHAVAVASLRRAIGLTPSMADAHAELGNALQHSGKSQDAIASYRRALAIEPEAGVVRFNLAKTLSAAGDADAALSECTQAVASVPALNEARMMLAGMLATRGHHDAAADHFRAVAQNAPETVEAWLGLAMVLRDMGQGAEAEAIARRACELRLDSTDARDLLGTILHKSGKLDEAEAVLRDAVALAPESAVSWNNLGIVLQEQGRLAESEAAYRTSLSCEPNQYEAYQNLSLVQRDQDRWQDVIATLDAWVAQGCDADRAHGERALVLLQLEDYARGWPEYESRWSREGMIARSFGYPLWDGSDLTGKTLLVYAEQGIGDEIMFASCFHELIAQAGTVVIDCAQRLDPLFRRSFPGAVVFGTEQVLNPGWLANSPPIDVEIAAGSVPRYLRKHPADFPAAPYLVPDPARVAHWWDRLAATGPGLKVGISWRGGRGVRAGKCSTNLADWKTLFEMTAVQFVNLQYGVRQEEWEEVARMGVKLHHWQDSDPLADLDDFAAQVAALDLVVTIDNATAHLAGALGVPVWVLQSHTPDWRWGISGKGHWYGNVQAFRQDRPRDWTRVFEEVRVMLATRVRNDDSGA